MAGWFAAPALTTAKVEVIDSPSLSVADGDDDRLLLRCFAGCDFVDILEELKHRWLVDGAQPSDEEGVYANGPSLCRAQP